MQLQKNYDTCRFQCKAQTLTGAWPHRTTDNIMFTDVTHFHDGIPVFALSANPIKQQTCHISDPHDCSRLRRDVIQPGTKIPTSDRIPLSLTPPTFIMVSRGSSETPVYFRHTVPRYTTEKSNLRP